MKKKFKNLETLLLPIILLVAFFNKPNKQPVNWGQLKVVVAILIVWILLITIKIGFYNYAVWR